MTGFNNLKLAFAKAGAHAQDFFIVINNYSKYTNSVIRLLSLRPDLDEETIKSEIHKLQQDSIQDQIYWLNICIIRAMKGDSLPWE